MLLMLAIGGCGDGSRPLPPLDVSEVKCNTHRDAAGMPACVHALDAFLAERSVRVVQVVAADDGTDETERLFVVHTRSDPRWPLASELGVSRLTEANEDDRAIVFTLRTGKRLRLYRVR